MNILNEAEQLKKRFLLDVEIIISQDKLKLFEYDPPARFDYNNKIILANKTFETEDILILLHEIGHAIQFRNGRLTTDDKVNYYAEEIEAEMIAVYWGEVIYGIRRQQWRLNYYEDYLLLGGFSKVRRIANTSAGDFMRKYKSYINSVTLENLYKLHELVDDLRNIPADKWTCERGTPIIIIN